MLQSNYSDNPLKSSLTFLVLSLAINFCSYHGRMERRSKSLPPISRAKQNHDFANVMLVNQVKFFMQAPTIAKCLPFTRRVPFSYS